MQDEKVNQGLALLRALERNIPMSVAADLLEMVTVVPGTIRRILEEAESAGMVKRTGGHLVVKETTGVPGGFDYPRKIKKPCADHCKRCNRAITSCYYILLSESAEVGPLGSECVKKFGLG